MKLSDIGESWDKIREWPKLALSWLISLWKLIQSVTPKIMFRSTYVELLSKIDSSESRYQDLMTELRKLIKIHELTNENFKTELNYRIKIQGEKDKYHQEMLEYKAEATKYKYAIEDIRRSLIQMTKERDELYNKLKSK